MSAPLAVDTRFLTHPAFAVLEPRVRERLAALSRFPAPSELRALCAGIPNALTPWFEFAQQQQNDLVAAGGFDRLIAESARIPTRVGSYHDLLGALIWLHFPALKTAIHRVQLSCAAAARGPRENAATLLDESGVLVLSSEPACFEALARLDWRALFWDQRVELQRTTRFLCFGHGLLDALRAPHPKLMGKALCVQVRPEHLQLDASELRVFTDRVLAERLATFLVEPACLQPLPVLGVPTWSTQQARAYYEDASYFQTSRQRAREPNAPRWLNLSAPC